MSGPDMARMLAFVEGIAWGSLEEEGDSDENLIAEARAILAGTAAQPSAEDRNARALSIAREFGQIQGDHHRAWVIEQITAALEGRPADASRGIAP